MRHAMPEYQLISELLGFGTGTVLSILLALLVRRAARRSPGTPLLAFCGLLWNAGGLITILLIVSGFNQFSWIVTIPRATFLSAGAIFPISFFMLWSRPLTPGAKRSPANVWLLRIAMFNAMWIIPLLYLCPLLPDTVSYRFSTYCIPFNASILLTIGAVTHMKGRLSATADRIYLVLTLVGVWGSTVAILLVSYAGFSRRLEGVLTVAKDQSPFLAVLGALFFLAKFRSSDVLIKQSLRLVAAVCIGLSAFVFIAGPLPALASRLSAFPTATLTALATAFIAASLLIFTIIDRAISRSADCWLLRRPDYRAALREIWDEMVKIDSEAELFGLVDQRLCHILEVDAARVLRRSEVRGIEAHAAANAGLLWELACDDECRRALLGRDIDVLAPVRVRGEVTHVIAVAPGAGNRDLLSRDLTFLQNVAGQLGSRLESLANERERIERRNREVRLLHLATEAELKALRAQVNPHFLFNSLNTIADLIVTDPPKAEAMTVLLARVFRHVLMHSDRPLTRVADEMEFLRTYLKIEEVRFGDRLRVRMEMDPLVSKEPIPSLILQPLVENAIKHGLAPKIGNGNLSITAEFEGEFLRLAVEDDGVGAAASDGRKDGVGLKIIAERLRSLYDGRATLSFEKAPLAGSRATILIPRTAVAA